MSEEEAIKPEVVPIPHHVKALEMPECKDCDAYEHIDDKSFYCSRRDKVITWVKK